jgi:hypothetical protein
MRDAAMRKRVRLWAIVLFFSVWLPSMSWAGGWYLMVAPPKDSKTERKPNLSWPLKWWDQRMSFDSASACEARRMRELAGYAALVAAASIAPNEPYNDALTDAAEQYLLHGDSSKIPPKLLGPLAGALLDFMPGYLCIATDDPRLK